MQIRLVLLLSLSMSLMMGCKTKHSGEPIETITAENLMDAFRNLKLPTEIIDTSLRRRNDTTPIPLPVLETYIPDSVAGVLSNHDKATFYPLGKIVKKEQTYLLVTVVQPGRKVSLVCYALDKKNKYLTHLLLINGSNNDGYTYSVNITGEPTFVVGRQKGGGDSQLWYTKSAFAYNKNANGFVNIMSDSNEGTRKASDTVNPIDTLPHKFPLSGDYVKDANNYLSLRDGRNERNYLFYIHFSKEGGECIGDLKGEIDLATATKGLYKVNGDPCIVDFNFEPGAVTVKEEGSCGNHRGIKCLFDDRYVKKKLAKPSKKRH